MVPTPLRYAHSSRLIYAVYSLLANNVPSLGRTKSGRTLARRDFDPHNSKDIVFACLIPILVLLSGVFAGLTLGYMSLDETQLAVLSISGTPKQREYANKIKPIRKNGHLLLVTLLLANMIVNESLPVIADPILGGGFQSVVVSTVLIVIFAEIVPQSVFTRHGLYLGAKMAFPTTLLIYGLGVVSWPVAKLLDLVLGSHHGIIYRRAELKELIAMHSSLSSHGGDLKTDTVAIIGSTLDLQEKVVRQAMTPIADVFMLSIDSKLDYELLRKICLTGHSRIPVYEEVDLGPPAGKVKKIIGILLVKQCVLLDPKDAVPLRKIPLNEVPFVPNNASLLGILDKFQEGRSHMAIVTRFGVEKAASVKKAVKRGLTRRLMERVGMGDSSDEEEAAGHAKSGHRRKGSKGSKDSKDKDTEGEPTLADGLTVTVDEAWDGEATLRDTSSRADSKGQEDEEAGAQADKGRRRGRRSGVPSGDLEMGIVGETDKERDASKAKRATFQVSMPAGIAISGKEQSMPADAVLAKEGAEEFLQGLDPAVMPLGIITLEDVLEELIGEEIYDEFDQQGAHGDPFVPGPPTAAPLSAGTQIAAPPLDVVAPTPAKAVATPALLRGLGFLRSRSAPPTPRDAPADGAAPGSLTPPPPAAAVPAIAVSAAPSTANLAGAEGRAAPKGTRFKSSPLGGGERAGVVVAERIRTEGGGEGRIPEQWEKAGPDKEKEGVEGGAV